MNTKVTLNKLPYYGENTQKTNELISKTASLSNEEILKISAAKTEIESSRSKPEKARKLLFPATIGILIGANGVLTKGGASKKLAVMGAGAASCFILNKAFDVANKILNKVSKNDNSSETKQTLVTLGTFAGGAALFTGARAGIGKASKWAAKKFPNALNSLKGHMKNFDKTVSNSKFAAVLKKVPKGPIKTVAKYAFPVAIAGYILGSFSLSNIIAKNKEEKFRENIQNLSELRDEAAVASKMLGHEQAAYNEIMPKNELDADIEGIIKAADKNEDINKAAKEALS